MFVDGRQRGRVGDGVAQHYDCRAKQGVMCRGGGVGELEAVGAVVEADVKGVGLIEVAEKGRRVAGRGIGTGTEG